MLKTSQRIAISICVLSVFLLFVLSACSFNTGYINSLQSLVFSNIISENDLKNIAALRNGSLQIVVNEQTDELELETIEYTATPVSEQLSDDQESDILSAFNKFIEDDFQNAHVTVNVASSEIVAYYGTYAGYAVAEVYFTLAGFDVTGNETDLIISDYYLGKISENSLIVCWTPNI